MSNVIVSERMKLVGIVILAKFSDGHMYVYGGNGTWYSLSGLVDTALFDKYTVDGAREAIERMRSKDNVEYIVAAPFYKVRVNDREDQFLINPIDAMRQMLKQTKMQEVAA
ncbi:hypothetical protein UFOVP350_36 [uncultured Caudovirales phage]|uniref:Uncharacterized protein n=1 Tax=uncultured Caudovirales phage TaxID=2100421 RepID=A0A6J5LYR7_9CAUD|nr:hypothetical protein UFOVP350_36 [uncultured Caudovirales phage]